MSQNKNNDSEKEETQQKWFNKEDLQEMAKIGGDFIKKTVSSGIDVFKEVKENIPKEASHFINKSKDDILRGLTQEMTKSMVAFSIEKIFKLARDHRLEFSLRLRRNDSDVENKNRSFKKTKRIIDE